jgi:hypothetical protein
MKRPLHACSSSIGIGSKALAFPCRVRSCGGGPCGAGKGIELDVSAAWVVRSTESFDGASGPSAGIRQE